MKLAGRVGVFVLGAALVVFGWYKAHGEVVPLQNPANTTTINSSEVLVVIGGFLALMAFLPSSERLARWASRKRRKAVPHAQFRRRHKA